MRATIEESDEIDPIALLAKLETSSKKVDLVVEEAYRAVAEAYRRRGLNEDEIKRKIRLEDLKKGRELCRLGNILCVVCGLPVSATTARKAIKDSNFRPLCLFDGRRKNKATLENRTKEQRRQAAIEGLRCLAKRTAEERSEAARKGAMNKTPEQRRNAALKAAASKTPEQRREIALKRQANKTPEQRRNEALKGVRTKTPAQRQQAARKAAFIVNANRSSEERRELARKAGLARQDKLRQDKLRQEGDRRE